MIVSTFEFLQVGVVVVRTIAWMNAVDPFIDPRIGIHRIV